MALDSVERFSSRVESYARYRPSYPRDLLGLLERDCGLTPDSRIADVGSGTGLLAQVFLAFGCDVTGIEPNPAMRAAAGRLLAAEPRFHSVDARAEATTLRDGSVDFVTAGQSFHWFDPAAARTEFQRILKSQGWVVLVWNERRATPGFMSAHEELQKKFAPEKPFPASTAFDAFYGHTGWRQARFPNPQSLDEEGLLGRMRSSSWSPPPGTDTYEPMMQALSALFRRFEQNGRVTMEYETNVYYGRLGTAEYNRS